MLDVYRRYGGGSGDDGGSFDEDNAETSFNSGISRRPASAPENVTLIHAREPDSESAERDRVALGNSGSSRGPGLSGARLGCTPRERRER